MKKVFLSFILICTIYSFAQNANWGTGLAVAVTPNGTNITCSVYDPILSQNRTTSLASDYYINSKGIVANVEYGNKVSYLIYDLNSHQWVIDFEYVSNTITLTNSDGVIAFVEAGNEVRYAVYDPSLQQWKEDFEYVSNAITLANSDGVIAFVETGNEVRYAVYDPSLQQWKDDFDYISGNVLNFNIQDGTIYYNYQSANYKYGYNKNSGQWQSNYNTDLYCKMFVSSSSSSAPLITYLWCLTIGANSYSYNCGDGHTITSRWAWKQYNNTGTHNPALTIFNSNQNGTCTKQVQVVGVEEFAGLNPKVSIFPNPTNSNSNMTVTSEEKISEIKIYNALGILMYYENNVNEQNKLIPLNETKFSKGIYFAEVITNSSNRSTKKFIIQ